ncbi:MAG: serine/threonine protein kinase, partial [Myxococcales bacterium]|nr:serine/threonine protein kinase [Myxococcales bacterium]
MTAPAPMDATERARRVQRLFDDALDLDDERRVAFLAQACGDDLALRAEVEGLIASLGRARTGELLPPLVPDFVPGAPPPPSASLVGLRFHNYQVDAVIGAGGMAEVYVAHHLVFPRRAALKVLQPQFSGNAEIVQRFINEARAANAIAHPNIIEVIDAGRLEGSGAPYILMEYLEGESLGARLRAGRLPLTEATRIFIQTAEAVGAAHDKGIVHRDLKPENIFLVRREGQEPLVKVLDFGIAKLRSDVAGTLAQQTQVGMVMGTPQYMSPEHCRDASAVDQRTDIYSLGVILYEMTCGRPPFQSATGFADLVYLHVAVAPQPPRELAPDLPPAVEAIILRCLAKSPNDRYPSVRDLIDALRAAAARTRDESGRTAVAMRDPTTMAATTNRTPQRAEPVARRRGKAIAAIVFAVAAIGGAALALGGRRGAEAPPTAPI